MKPILPSLDFISNFMLDPKLLGRILKKSKKDLDSDSIMEVPGKIFKHL